MAGWVAGWLAAICQSSLPKQRTTAAAAEFEKAPRCEDCKKKKKTKTKKTLMHKCDLSESSGGGGGETKENKRFQLTLTLFSREM